METTAKGVTLINIKAKPFDFIGKKGDQVKGTSYRATLSGGEEVFVVKTDESVFKDAGECKNQEGDAELEIKKDVVSGTLSLYLKKFNWVA